MMCDARTSYSFTSSALAHVLWLLFFPTLNSIEMLSALTFGAAGLRDRITISDHALYL